MPKDQASGEPAMPAARSPLPRVLASPIRSLRERARRRDRTPTRAGVAPIPERH